jgi:hypothetical protein
MYSGYGAYDRPLAKRQVTQVSDPNSAWFNQESHWVLIEDLMGGTYHEQEASPVSAAGTQRIR